MSNNKDFVVAGAVEVGKDTKVTFGTVTSNNIDLATGNYFADTLAADTTYTLSNAGDVQAFQLEVTGGAVPYGLADSTLTETSGSDTGNDPTAMRFKSDGTRFWVVGSFDNVYQYDLSTAYDLSTKSTSNIFYNISQDTDPTSFYITSDGTKMYVAGNANNTVYQYTLGTAYNVTTASYANKSFSTSGQTTSPDGVFFKDDGSKMYISTDGVIYQYSLSTYWDVSTASYDTVSLDTTGETLYTSDLMFDNSGSVILIIARNESTAIKYNLSTAWDLSTATSDGSFSFASYGTQSTTAQWAATFANSGQLLYAVQKDSNPLVYEFSSLSSTTLTWPSSIEWAGGIAPAAPATGETDVYTLVTDDGGTSYVGVKTADNLS